MIRISVWIHIIAAMFWIGGMLFLTLVIAPFLKEIGDPDERSRIYQKVGTSFRFWGWIAISLLILTGMSNLYLFGVPFGRIFTSSFLSTSYGRAIGIKIMLVTTIVVLSFLHDFFVGPMARDNPYYSNIARWIGRFNLLLALLIVLFGVFIRFGGI